MEGLIELIDEITKFGLYPLVELSDKERNLEWNLIKLYKLYFDIKLEQEHFGYANFDKSTLPNIRQNIELNFPSFGFYHSPLNMVRVEEEPDCGIGDAVDDLLDIVIDLLEIKWRIENNSLADGLWFFDFTFTNHLKEHILGLLSFMKQKELENS